MKKKARVLKKIGKSFFIKLLCTYFVLIFTIIFTVFLITVNLYSERMQENYAQSHEKMLLQADYSMEEIYEQANLFCTQVMQDKYVSMGIFQENITEGEYYNIRNSLADAVSTSSHIHSAYLYNQRSGRFINSNFQPYDVERGDQDILSIIRRRKERPKAGFSPHIADYEIMNEHYRENLLSLVMLPFGVSNESAIVVNLSDGCFQDLFVSMDNEQKNYFLVIDKEGLLVSASVDYTFMEDVSQTAYFQRMKEEAETASNFMEEVDGSHCLVSYLYNPNMELYLVSVLDYEMIRRDTLNLLRGPFALLVALLGGSIVMAYVLGRQIFSPIRQVSDKMGYQPGESTAADEIHYIDSRLGDMLHQISSLEQETEEYYLRERQLYLKKLLEGEKFYRQEELEKFSWYDGKELLDCPLQLLYLKISKFDLKELGSDEQLYFAKRGILECAEECLSEYGKLEMIDMGINRAVLLLSGEKQLPEEKLREWLRSIRQQKHLSVKVSCGNPCSSPEQLYQSFMEVEEALSYEFQYGGEEIFDWNRIQESRKKDTEPIRKSREKMEQLIRGAKEEEALSAVRKHFELLAEYDCKIVNQNLIQLGLEMEEITGRMENSGAFFNQYKYKSLIQIISQQESLDKVCTFFLHLSMYLIQETQREKSRRKQDIAQSACLYIEKNYQNPDLSAEEVAGELNLSAPYFSKMFKESMEMTYIEYLVKVRLKKAEELLRTTDRSVEEIGRDTGFSTASYFASRFRKEYGMSPSKYRAEAEKRGEE